MKARSSSTHLIPSGDSKTFTEPNPLKREGISFIAEGLQGLGQLMIVGADAVVPPLNDTIHGFVIRYARSKGIALTDSEGRGLWRGAYQRTETLGREAGYALGIVSAKRLLEFTRVNSGTSRSLPLDVPNTITSFGAGQELPLTIDDELYLLSPHTEPYDDYRHRMGRSALVVATLVHNPFEQTVELCAGNCGDLVTTAGDIY